MKLARSTARLAKSGLIIFFLPGFLMRAPGAVVCDLPPVPVSIISTNSILSVLSSNPLALILKLASPVGNDTHLGLSYTGTVRNGIDVDLLPGSVSIGAFQTAALVTVKPEAIYPFGTKSLTVTIISSDNACVFIGSPNVATITLTGFAPPTLQATWLGPTNIVLSWWAPVPGYALQSANNLLSPQWTPVAEQPTEVQGTNTLALKPSGGTTFYRLMKP